MKEATGELNMTVFVVVAIGVMSAFFFTVLWPSLKETLVANSKCRDAVCDANSVSDGMATCQYYTSSGSQVGGSFKCVWKG